MGAMIRWQPWIPVGLAMVTMAVSLFAVAHTPRSGVDLPPLPAPVHIDGPVLVQLRSEAGHPLFAPSRSNAPLVVDLGAAASAPLPTLTGIAMGGSRALALVKSLKGETVIVHVGDVVDGWTISVIATQAITFERAGETHEVALAFDRSGAESNTKADRLQ